jgi:ankyrin repeat protein
MVLVLLICLLICIYPVANAEDIPVQFGMLTDEQVIQSNYHFQNVDQRFDGKYDIPTHLLPYALQSMTITNPTWLQLAIATQKPKTTRMLLLKYNANTQFQFINVQLIELYDKKYDHRFVRPDGKTRILKERLAKNQDILQGVTLLQLAALVADLETVKLLLILNGKQKIDVNESNAKDKSDRSVLEFDAFYLAAKYSSFSIVKTISESQDLIMQSRDRIHVFAPMHPIHIAALQNDIRLIDYLVLKRKLDVNTQMHHGFADTSLHLAIASHNIQLVKHLVDDLKADLTIRSMNKQRIHISVLQQAVMSKDAAIHSYLISQINKNPHLKPKFEVDAFVCTDCVDKMYKVEL